MALTLSANTVPLGPAGDAKNALRRRAERALCNSGGFALSVGEKPHPHVMVLTEDAQRPHPFPALNGAGENFVHSVIACGQHPGLRSLAEHRAHLPLGQIEFAPPALPIAILSAERGAALEPTFSVVI